MSTWNYRVCKETHTFGGFGGSTETSFSIREAYYNAASDIYAVSSVSAGLHGEDLNELRSCLVKMDLALSRSVVDLDTVVFAVSTI